MLLDKLLNSFYSWTSKNSKSVLNQIDDTLTGSLFVKNIKYVLYLYLIKKFGYKGDFENVITQFQIDNNLNNNKTIKIALKGVLYSLKNTKNIESNDFDLLLSKIEKVVNKLK